MKMPASIKIQQKANNIINNERESAVQTALTGSTVYSLPKRTPKRNMVDIVLSIMGDDGPMPMRNMRPAKKTRNAVNQFYDEHQVEYDTRGQSARDQIDRVHTHNNAYPKMYDELNKRRSIAQVGMPGLDGFQAAAALKMTPIDPSNENLCAKFDPRCPKCIRRRKRMEEERKIRGPLCKKCREELNRKESKHKLDRVSKNKTPKPKKQQTRCRSTKGSKPSIICSNKCFQCYLTAETKTVSTFKSNDNFLPVRPVPQELTPSTNIKENQEKNVLTIKSSHKKRVNKKPPSLKSDQNRGNMETETGASVSSYNSFMSTEHEPMVE